MCLLENGPYVYAIGGVNRPDFVAEVAIIGTETLNVPVTFPGNGTCRSLTSFSLEEMQVPLPQAVLKASGVSRARNAARSTIYAALLAKKFISYINELPSFDPNRVAIGIANCSSSAAISWEFETEGITLGWDKTNTLLMPSALPSAIVTQISNAIKTHAAAITFLDDIMGMRAAIEYTHLSFFHDRSDYAFIIGTEELSKPHEKVLVQLKKNLSVQFDGAAGVLFSREILTDSAWQLSLSLHEAEADQILLPDSWSEAKVLELVFSAEDVVVFSTLILPYALYHLFSTYGTGKVAFIVKIENHGSFALGFQHKTR